MFVKLVIVCLFSSTSILIGCRAACTSHSPRDTPIGVWQLDRVVSGPKDEYSILQDIEFDDLIKRMWVEFMEGGEIVVTIEHTDRSLGKTSISGIYTLQGEDINIQLQGKNRIEFKEAEFADGRVVLTMGRFVLYFDCEG